MILPLQKQVKHMQIGAEILMVSSFMKTQALTFTSCLYFSKKVTLLFKIHIICVLLVQILQRAMTKQVLQLRQSQSRQANADCSSGHTDPPVSMLFPFWM